MYYCCSYTNWKTFIYSEEYKKKCSVNLRRRVRIFFFSTAFSLVFLSFLCPFCVVPFAFSLILSIPHLLHLSHFNHCPVAKGTACVVGTCKGEFSADKITSSIHFLRDKSPSMKNIIQIFKIFITFYVMVL